jgi:hypothetical protein
VSPSLWVQGKPRRRAGFTRAREANARRNAQAPAHRPVLWRAARDQLWALLDPILASGATVAVVGAGNCDDLPLTRLGRRAHRVDLIDIDPTASKRAVRRAPRELLSWDSSTKKPSASRGFWE